jgi:hypothetical protein
MWLPYKEEIIEKDSIQISRASMGTRMVIRHELDG